MAKHEMERRCLQFAARSHTEVVILQPTCVFGPFGSDFVTSQLDGMLSGSFFWIEAGNGTANLIYVDNLVDAAILAAERPCRSGSRFIVNEEEYRLTWRDYFGELSDQVLALPADSFPCLTIMQLEDVFRQRRRMRSFPQVIRQAIRSDPLAREWLRDSWAFRIWSGLKQFTGKNAQRTTHADVVRPVGSADNAARDTRDLRQQMISAPKLGVTSSVVRFFASQSVYGSKQIRKELAWSPRVERSQAIQATIAWARQAYAHRLASEPKS
jgi:nucleoside-diphosphate-sugar epimerase